MRALTRGDSLGAALADAGAPDLASGASRVVHVAIVLTAVSLMFLPTANTYFRAACAPGRPTAPGREHRHRCYEYSANHFPVFTTIACNLIGYRALAK